MRRNIDMELKSTNTFPSPAGVIFAGAPFAGTPDCLLVILPFMLPVRKAVNCMEKLCGLCCYEAWQMEQPQSTLLLLRSIVHLLAFR